jgi:phosphoribosylformylglycinamidine synthase
LETIWRVITEKKKGFASESERLLADINGFLGLKASGVRLFNIYDVQGAPEGGIDAALYTVFGSAAEDTVYREHLPPFPPDTARLAVQALPGQFDVRAESCAQCLQMLWGGARPLVRHTLLAVAEGMASEHLPRLKSHLINPVESREASLDKPASLTRGAAEPEPEGVCEGFTALGEAGLAAFAAEHKLVMDTEDLAHLRDYMRSEGREPTVAELLIADAYWSDHCRHTTFRTELTEIDTDDPRARAALDAYYAIEGEGAATLMGMATASMRALRPKALVRSAEVNACTVAVKARVNGHDEDRLVLFKNETHNHPTEIEPFGGAATCLGGAIRDPLSGRAYVYQAMRVTGSADPRAPFSATPPGKLPQRVITAKAAAGFSSYGNQVGVATCFTDEYYHPGYAAKRFECGAVVGAVRESAVARSEPLPGDAVLLVGGRTGRDGIGGASGSSVAHSEASVTERAAEVQKGNAPEERKLMRLFLNPAVTRKVKRCNDFGAGGVAVALGEIAEGLRVDLSAVPLKYEGLSGRHIALSESQERMAAVLAPEDVDYFIREAAKENLEATVVARVTRGRRFTLEHNGAVLADLSREFLDSGGAKKYARARIPAPALPVPPVPEDLGLAERWLLTASHPNFCSKRGLQEMFDSTIGSGSVLAPYGGRAGLCPSQVMAALLPESGAETATVMSCAFDPELAEADPFAGGHHAVTLSLARLAAAGVLPGGAYLSLQEYFPAPQGDPSRWGLPCAALLGALSAQLALGVPAIGGKDSMSGTFEGLDVPPTIVSFALGLCHAEKIISPDFKACGSCVYLFSADNAEDLPALWSRALEYGPRSAFAVDRFGVSGGIIKMSLGGFGFRFDDGFTDYFACPPGALLAELPAALAEPAPGVTLVGRTSDSPYIETASARVPLSALLAAWESPLESVFPARAPSGAASAPPDIPVLRHAPPRRAAKAPSAAAKPAAVIPVFPGTNCELDTARALEAAGASPKLVIIRNLTPSWLADSAEELERALTEAQMLVIPGGFSGSDEPDGSGKYIAAFFRSERIAAAVGELHGRGGLILGICNGFQALLKIGLLPFGAVTAPDPDAPTLTRNAIGRHMSRYARTAVCSKLSPWLSRCETGEVYTVPVSHGEGRFAASAEWLERLRLGGQIAQQYCDEGGRPGAGSAVNPNGSAWAVEAISSPCGRILGKMAHSERAGKYVGVNVPGQKYQPLFEGGVDYFRL